MLDRISVDGRGVATLSLKTKHPLNIFSSNEARAAAEAIRSLYDREEIVALVITGAAERTFIGGADIKEMSALDPASGRKFIRSLYELCEAIRDFPAPTIARIHSWCLGVGVEFVAACDIRIASEDARFAMPEVRIGIPSVIQATLLTRLIGEGRSRWLLLTGGTIDAAQAERWGLVTDVADPTALDGAVDRVLHDLLESDPAALRSQKHLLRVWEDPHLDHSMLHSIDVFGCSFETDAPRARMQAFLNKSKK